MEVIGKIGSDSGLTPHYTLGSILLIMSNDSKIVVFVEDYKVESD